MPQPTKQKTARQLDREIAEAIGRRRSPSTLRHSRRHHSTIAVLDAPAAGSWDVAMDAIFEHDPARAAAVVRQLKAAHGPVPMPDTFSKALDKAPKTVREAFEKATGIISKQHYDWKAFTEGAAYGFWASPYVSEVENYAREPAVYRALAPRSGGKWDSVLPDVPPAAKAVAKKFTKTVREQLSDEQLAEVAAKFSPYNAGYYGAMQSQGEGVGWYDEGVDVDPPSGFDYDPKIANAVDRAIRREARQAGVRLPQN